MLGALLASSGDGSKVVFLAGALYVPKYIRAACLSIPKKVSLAKSAEFPQPQSMASAITRARKELQKLNNRRRNDAAKRREERAQTTQAVGVLAGAAAAALVDEKFGEGGDVAEVFNVPTNAVVGAGAVVAAATVRALPFRREIGAVGLGMASTSLYQLIRENVDFD